MFDSIKSDTKIKAKNSMYKNKKNAKSTNLVRIPFYEMTKIRTSSEKFHRVSSIVQNLTFSIGRKKKQGIRNIEYW